MQEPFYGQFASQIDNKTHRMVDTELHTYVCNELHIDIGLYILSFTNRFVIHYVVT